MNQDSQAAPMLDFLVTIRETERGLWPSPDKESAAAIGRWAAGQPVGMVFAFRVLKRLPTRSKQHHALYRLRNSILAPALDTDADSLHDNIKLELDMIEEYTIAGKTKSRLRSQKEFSIEEMSAMFHKQDELRDFVNCDREPQNYLLLPTGDPLERSSL